MLEKNLKALAKYNVELVDELCSMGRNETLCDDREIFWGESEEGELISYIQNGVKPIKMASEYSVKNQCFRWFQQYEPYIKEEDNFFYVFGVGTGEAVRVCYEAVRSKGRMVLYEPNPEYFLQVLERVDLSAVFRDEAVRVCVGDMKTSVYDVLQQLYSERRIVWSEMVLIRLPMYQQLYSDEWNNYLGTLYGVASVAEGEKASKRMFLEHTVAEPIRNLDYYKNGLVVERIKKDWNPKLPVIIVSAGPSLDKNKHLLHQAKGRILIVAVDMAVQALEQIGVVPDFIVSLDENVQMQYVEFEELRKVPLLSTTRTRREYYDWNQGEKILFREQKILQRIKEKVGLPEAHYTYFGSVSIAAFSIFCMLGAKRIVFIGQDLAYGEDGQTHAGVYNEGERNDKIPVPGYYGGTIYSRPDWFQYWKYYEETIPTLDGVQVIDATEGGAEIPGTQKMSLKEVLELFGNQSVDLDMLYRQENRVSAEEYGKMEVLIRQCQDEVYQLSEIQTDEYEDEKHRIQCMEVWPLLSDVMDCMEAASEAECFVAAVCYMLEHGWKREGDKEAEYAE